jgi:ketosteroid isomerase-like protein
MDNADLIRELAERWNAGDFEGALELYADDAVMLSGSEWPEQFALKGHDGIRANMEDWAAAWESSQIEVGPIEVYGDRILGSGTWKMRGLASGAEGTMPFWVLLGFRDGKIASLEWFTDHDAAIAAARGS